MRSLYLFLAVIALAYSVKGKTCKNNQEKCRSDDECYSGYCKVRGSGGRGTCADKQEDASADGSARAQRNLRMGDVKNPGLNTRQGIKGENYRWPDATVPYELDPAFSEEERGLILKSFKEIEDVTCVTFEERTDEEDWLYYRRGRNTGCNSYVGRQGKKQILNLEVGETSTCMTQDIIVHETIHALGFQHEHVRYDRDDYVQINWDNIACPEQFNFFKENSSTIETFGVSYDYNSIMHYGNNEGGIDPAKPTIIPKKKGVKLSGKKITKLDAEKINKMYKCVTN